MGKAQIAEEVQSLPSFESKIKENAIKETLEKLDIMQINIGRTCNLACKHCHVEAGPERTERMTKETMQACLIVFQEQGFSTLDITGGTPEMNPDFEWLILEASKVCEHVIVRTNAVILTEEMYSHLPELYAEHKVEIICSLPYYRAKEADRQRGVGVFSKVIEALKRLNELGYGKTQGLVLNLVYNPNGAILPPDQTAMEKEYKQRLKADFGIEFNHLFTITNNPTGRFAAFLKRSGNLDSYMKRLYVAFNEGALEGMMCRNQLSVGYDGKLYDCDFNQAAELPVKTRETICDLAGKPYKKREICFGRHCYGCTAGQGSSCGGATD